MNTQHEHQQSARDSTSSQEELQGRTFSADNTKQSSSPNFDSRHHGYHHIIDIIDILMIQNADKEGDLTIHNKVSNNYIIHEVPDSLSLLPITAYMLELRSRSGSVAISRHSRVDHSRSARHSRVCHSLSARYNYRAPTHDSLTSQCVYPAF